MIYCAVLDDWFELFTEGVVVNVVVADVWSKTESCIITSNELFCWISDTSDGVKLMLKGATMLEVM